MAPIQNHHARAQFIGDARAHDLVVATAKCGGPVAPDRTGPRNRDIGHVIGNDHRAVRLFRLDRNFGVGIGVIGGGKAQPRALRQDDRHIRPHPQTRDVVIACLERDANGLILGAIHGRLNLCGLIDAGWRNRDV